jgi:hypothetical protein
VTGLGFLYQDLQRRPPRPTEECPGKATATGLTQMCNSVHY